ncbi:UDP-N-acetylmuramate dehydrogenase [Lichenicoccus sp.]|uniref:UDP-N-acetylmuramate dehydrogenase n=1 Tax=Lichenicoccus sp. TaxID=2781899 RepID=UPI003D0C7E41
MTATDLALPRLRGRLTADAPLGAQSWFRVGGNAEVLARPEDAEDLAGFLRGLSPEIPVRAIGVASNLIIRDGGVPGVVVRLAPRGFGSVRIEADGIVAGAACLDGAVAEHAAKAGLAGLEFLAGIPGSIGGAVAMNAGAYGSAMADVLDWADIVTRVGEALRLPAHALGLGYRRSSLPPGAVVTAARLRATPGDREMIAGRIAAIRATREASQPVRARTGGSTFRNPDPAESSRRAWELIEAAGCRGLALGGAAVSEKHCNFLLNTGGATAGELEALGEMVRAKVRAASGVELVWEIKRIGVPGGLAP